VASASSSSVPPSPGPIGPGRVVLVVGPSGAGKDTVLREVRNRLAGDARFVFPRRIVTREANAAEDHDTVTPAAFDAQLERGAFALHWQAHGLSYGIPASMDEAVRRGATVVFNASRGVVPVVRARYRNAAVVLIDAPLGIRAERLAARDRESSAEVAARLERVAAGFSAEDSDLVIDNTGAPGGAAAQLVAWLKARHEGG
jgi:ribose 1,5-bisphosphokinase